MLRLITAATTTPVDNATVKARLRIEDNVGDLDLELLIRAATAAVEKEAQIVLQRSTWEYRLDTWPCWFGRTRFDGALVWPWPAIQIPSAPVVDVEAITYLDADGAEQTIAAENYSWERTSEGADIAFQSGFTFPVLSTALQPVRVRFVAGYNEAGASGSGIEPELALPPTAQMAVLFLVGHWYRNRLPIGEQAFDIPDTFKYLADQLKVYR